MKWYTVFNSRTKFSDYRNMAPLPQMSEQAMQCFRQKRLEAQNGSINPTVYAVVTAKDVLKAPRNMLVAKADLEEETVDHLLAVLRKEFKEFDNKD